MEDCFVLFCYRLFHPKMLKFEKIALCVNPVPHARVHHSFASEPDKPTRRDRLIARGQRESVSRITGELILCFDSLGCITWASH